MSQFDDYLQLLQPTRTIKLCASVAINNTHLQAQKTTHSNLDDYGVVMNVDVMYEDGTYVLGRHVQFQQQMYAIHSLFPHTLTCPS